MFCSLAVIRDWDSDAAEFSQCSESCPLSFFSLLCLEIVVFLCFGPHHLLGLADRERGPFLSHGDTAMIVSFLLPSFSRWGSFQLLDWLDLVVYHVWKGLVRIFSFSTCIVRSTLVLSASGYPSSSLGD